MLLTAGCDGSVLLSNCKGGFHRARGEASLHARYCTLVKTDKQGLMQQRMMQMDYDLHTGEYRLLDNFLPEVGDHSRQRARLISSTYLLK